MRYYRTVSRLETLCREYGITLARVLRFSPWTTDDLRALPAPELRKVLAIQREKKISDFCGFLVDDSDLL